MTSPKAKILLVEDDNNLGKTICNFLETLNFHVVLAKNGQEGIAEFNEGSFDIVLLNISLPLLDGFTVAEEIRKKDCQTPIIFVTSKAIKEEMIRGFRLGADDYIIKPFIIEELKLRILAILKRTHPKAAMNNTRITFAIGHHTFDYSNHLLISAGTERKLTRREADLLHLLCRNMNSILRRDIALKTIWGENDYFMGRSMDVYIAKLRKMLGSDPDVAIVNIHNTGFRLETKKPQ
jgi:two-component system, OmpR family, response regulator